MLAAVEPYRPGEFYRRELPPLRAVIPARRRARSDRGRWLC